ncbi:PIN domain-containing protein [Patescibacteria group bacterium]|nr:PIN domain-containing protein [Patescibacteria group bacterium]MCG2701668.1 PIN domain-containing protein [Candidatus Parcubacteria bacterium]MBU4210880.1 PIN domain-containing protein [Patescibacteria group bacterium]MBU4265016.1 PIN domain-containing protein [Patescibacteria group bacterium]MBU4390169.1 PIN domain-containing protein [Patescibacteria group bacterium]
MKKYLLDTDTIIYFLRGKKKINIKNPNPSLSISLITYAELLYGAYKSTNQKKSIQTIKDFIKTFNIDILNLNQKIISIYSKTKANLDTTGQKIDDFDLFIASTAIFYKLTIITNNLRHFSRIPNLQIHH